jgi:hypothetical protein
MILHLCNLVFRIQAHLYSQTPAYKVNVITPYLLPAVGFVGTRGGIREGAKPGRNPGIVTQVEINSLRNPVSQI